MTVFPPILIPLFVPFCERLCMMLPEALSDAAIRYQWEAHSVGLVERYPHTADNYLLITLLTCVLYIKGEVTHADRLSGTTVAC